MAERIEYPLRALKNSKLCNLFTRMLAHRYRTDILIDYYRLPNVYTHFSFYGQRISPEEKALREVDFIKGRLDSEDHEAIVEAFWEQMLPQGDHLADHVDVETKYNEIAVYASDLRMIKSVLYLYPEHHILDVADIGAGRNRLGQAIIEYFNNTNDSTTYLNWIQSLENVHHGSKDVTVIGTDINDWQDEDAKHHNGLEYRIQPSPSRIPIQDSSRDMIITKWCFHHMPKHQMKEQIRNIFRALKPGGIAIVIEGFLTSMKALPEEDSQEVPELTYVQMLLEVSRRIEFADIWPEGPWKQDCYSISKDYLGLTCEDQRRILAIEDYYGHYVLNKRRYMPFPYSYMPAEELIGEFRQAGFAEQRWNFLLFGSAPIIRRGPFSARFIFQKPIPQ